jgi:hypothetical protein
VGAGAAHHAPRPGAVHALTAVPAAAQAFVSRWLEFCVEGLSFPLKEFLMQMLYNSDSFAVVMFDVPGESVEGSDNALNRGGYEIVDKFARREIFIEGALAQSFKEGVEALIESQPSEEEIDEYLGRFSVLMQHPVVLH